jgi:hypothetical protein
MLDDYRCHVVYFLIFNHTIFSADSEQSFPGERL